MHVLGHLTVEEFLRDYWHKKPVLIRNAWPNFQPLLTAQELAGLSLEEEIESRIVQEEGPDEPWQVGIGPFTEETFRDLPAEKWTLLIQAVDHWIPEAADLLEHFRFIPSWRVDDLMISYAVDGGSVGPHYDQYDVFLLQAQGQREWRLGQMCDENTPSVKGLKIRLLENFEQSASYVLNPGDMLYLPPKIAHWGIAQGECMTYSVGYRAPNLSELIQATADVIAANASDDARYADADLTLQSEPGRIDENAALRLKNLLINALNDTEQLQAILGRLMTEPKYQELLPEADDELELDEIEELLEDYPTWRRAEFARFAYSTYNGRSQFYALGMSRELSEEDEPFLAYLANNHIYNSEKLFELASTEAAQELLLQLWRKDCFYSPEMEEEE